MESLNTIYQPMSEGDALNGNPSGPEGSSSGKRQKEVEIQVSFLAKQWKDKQGISLLKGSTTEESALLRSTKEALLEHSVSSDLQDPVYTLWPMSQESIFTVSAPESLGAQKLRSDLRGKYVGKKCMLNYRFFPKGPHSLSIKTKNKTGIASNIEVDQFPIISVKFKDDSSYYEGFIKDLTVVES